MSAIKSNFRLWGPISLALVIALFVAQAEAKELIGSTHTDDCLVAPNSPAPQGSQWNFRLERKTQRKCWYMLASGKVKQKPAHPDISGVAIPLPRPRARALPATGDVVTAPTANAVAVPAPMSSDPGTQGMETARNPEPDKNSSIQATPVPESSIPSEPTAEDVPPARNSPAASGAANANIAPSIQDASANPMNNPPEARIEESISAPNVAATGSPATDDAIPDASAVHASVSSESSAQNFAPIPRVSERFATLMDDAAEQSVREEHNPPASPETFASTATSSQADAVTGPARKVELAGSPHNVGMPDTGQRHSTPPMLQSGSQSGSNGEIDLQTLIAIALTVATGLVVVGMLLRAGLLDRAARRKLIAATETPDPYDAPEFYRKLREGNFA
jgi:hypothetical protein